MKLIAETEYESQVIYRLADLLRDLGIDAEGFKREEAVAEVFWTPDDFTMELASIHNATKEDRISFLMAIEDKLRSAMITAGYEVITQELTCTHRNQLYLAHRQMQ